MRRGLAFRLSTLVLTATGLVLVAVVATSYVIAREALLQNAEANARTLSQALVNRIEAVLAPIPGLAHGVAYDLEDGVLSDEGIERRQRRILADNDAVFGMAVAYEPFVHRANERYFAPYVCRTPMGIKKVNLGGDNYRYHGMDWYQVPRELDRTVWSEPYFDKGGGDILMSTCSMPFHRVVDGKRVVAGVVTADVSLEWLKRLVAGTSVLDTGYAFLISKTGTYVTHPAPGVAFNETIFSRAEEHGSKALRSIGQDMIHGGSHFVPLTSLHTGKQGFLVYAPLPSTGWSLGVFYPRDELLADVHRQAMVSAALGGGGFLALAALVAFIARSITLPLRRLTVAAREVAGGNLEAPLPVSTARDEVGELAVSFTNMQTSLRAHIRDLTQATASRERMESELRIAHDIQMGILPKLFPPFPDRPEIDLYASLTPAREVGGDFYDFFPCGEDQFCFLVGDVSGKGVPAAFYMAVAKTLIKAVAESAAGSGQRRTGDDSPGAERRRGPDPGASSPARATIWPRTMSPACSSPFSAACSTCAPARSAWPAPGTTRRFCCALGGQGRVPAHAGRARGRGDGGRHLHHGHPHPRPGRHHFALHRRRHRGHEPGERAVRRGQAAGPGPGTDRAGHPRGVRPRGAQRARLRRRGGAVRRHHPAGPAVSWDRRKRGLSPPQEEPWNSPKPLKGAICVLSGHRPHGHAHRPGV